MYAEKIISPNILHYIMSDFLTTFKIPDRNRIDDFLVESPYLVPFHKDHRFRTTLSDDELFQTLDCHSSSQNTSDSRHTRIIPSVN